MQNYKNLRTWQKGIELVKQVYIFSSRLPSEEKFGLTSQIRRAAVSIPANIAEGTSRRSDKDFFRFLEIALGSLFELETLLIICIETEISEEKTLNDLFEIIDAEKKMIYRFQTSLGQYTN